jgi:D-glycero-alpha-D-manno-heptose 1-phosphate guanylyltransferase
LEAIVLAGGFGTRLQDIVSDQPKSMADVNGHPFLDYLLNYLTGQGIRRVILSVGYKKEAIREHFKDRFKSLSIEYAIEDEPLGTGGGIRNALKMVEGESAFTLNGDSLFRIDFRAMMKLHTDHAADLTLALKYLDDTARFGTVMIDGGNRITGFAEKMEDSGPGYINGGIYLINKNFLQSMPFPERFSIEKDCFEKYYGKAKIYGYLSKGYFLDIGIPEDYQKAQDEFRRFED